MVEKNCIIVKGMESNYEKGFFKIMFRDFQSEFFICAHEEKKAYI